MTSTGIVNDRPNAPSPAELAGRVLVGGFHGVAPPPWLLTRAARGQLGGVVLFRRNVGALSELARTTGALIDAFAHAPLIAVDQEGGRVARLDAPVLPLPPMRTLGQIDDEAHTGRLGALLGRQLAALGINWNFAPVLDVDTNPANPVIGDRSFGRTPERVIRHARAFSRGLQGAGVLACGKHFPGHGDTDSDSHHTLPVVRHDRSRLDQLELAPFRELVDELGSVMTAHIVVQALDPSVPATLSRPIVEGLLRGELCYRGVIVSDDLEMKAVAERFSPEELAVSAVEAGCDVVLFCSDEAALARGYQALVVRANQDEAFLARLRDAAQRIEHAASTYPATSVADAADEVHTLYQNEGRALSMRFDA